MFKLSAHALDRIKERTKLNPELIPLLEAAADSVFTSSTGQYYYLPLTDDSGKVLGYAAFKTVGSYPRSKLVLATILGPSMTPKGISLSATMKQPHIKHADEKKPSNLSDKIAPGLGGLFGHDIANIGLNAGLSAISNQKATTTDKSFDTLLKEMDVKHPVALREDPHTGHAQIHKSQITPQIAKELNMDPKNISDVVLKPRGVNNEAMLAHEIGHSKWFDKGLDKQRMALYRGSNQIANLGGAAATAVSAASDEPSYKPTLGALATNAPRLFEEAGASTYAAKHLMKQYGFAKGLRKSLPLAAAYGTYALPTIIPAGVTAARKLKDKYKKKTAEATQIDPELQKRFKELTNVLKRKGVFTGTAHKRINIPKSKLSESDLKSLNFVPVNVAIPEAGQDRITSYRNTNNNYHIHSHDDVWTMHEDRHPAATMMARKAKSLSGALSAYIKGIPHLVTEGIPGIYHYVMNSGKGPMKQRIEASLTSDAKKKIDALPNTKNAYENGIKLALQKMGLDIDEPEEKHTGRNIAIGAAAAAPFAGLIGQEKMIHRDVGPNMTYNQLRKNMRAGDIVLTGGKDMDFAKMMINSSTGTPEGYHVGMATDNKGNIVHSHPAYGIKKQNLGMAAGTKERIQVLRPTHLNPEELKQQVSSVEDLNRTGVNIEQQVKNNLKGKRYSKQDLKGFGEVSRGALYNSKQSISAGLKELFLPKLRSDAAIETKRQEVVKANTALKTKVPSIAKNMSSIVDDLSRPKELNGLRGLYEKGRDKLRDKALKMDNANKGDLLNNLINMTPSSTEYNNSKIQPLIPDGSGGVCSTVPATALPKGKNVVPGKLPTEILPSDYLRSKNYVSVGRYNPYPKSGLHEKLLRYGPNISRGAVGLGLAGGVYGASKLYDRFKAKKEQPEVVSPG